MSYLVPTPILSPLTTGAGGFADFALHQPLLTPLSPLIRGGPSLVVWRLLMRKPLVTVLHPALAAVLSPLTRGAGGVGGFCPASTAFNPPVPPCQGGTEFGRLGDAHA